MYIGHVPLSASLMLPPIRNMYQLLSFVSPKVRLVTLEILCLLDQYCTTDETTAHGGKVLTTCLEVERTETNLQNVSLKISYVLLQLTTYVSTYHVFV